jgi:hypothetical protein
LSISAISSASRIASPAILISPAPTASGNVAKLKSLRGSFEHVERRGRDFRPDAVARQNDNPH